jgi:hypothetical protein
LRTHRDRLRYLTLFLSEPPEWAQVVAQPLEVALQLVRPQQLVQVPHSQEAQS